MIDTSKSLELHSKGLAQQKRGKTQEAIELFKSAIATNPKIICARSSLGVLLINQKKYDQAL